MLEKMSKCKKRRKPRPAWPQFFKRSLLMVERLLVNIFLWILHVESCQKKIVLGGLVLQLFTVLDALLWIRCSTKCINYKDRRKKRSTSKSIDMTSFHPWMQDCCLQVIKKQVNLLKSQLELFWQCARYTLILGDLMIDFFLFVWQHIYDFMLVHLIVKLKYDSSKVKINEIVSIYF
jgi:hypothetical protein